jgi:hypothetical protein
MNRSAAIAARDSLRTLRYAENRAYLVPAQICCGKNQPATVMGVTIGPVAARRLIYFWPSWCDAVPDKVAKPCFARVNPT